MKPPRELPPPTLPQLARFWKRVDFSSDGHWRWTYVKNADGYGLHSFRQRNCLAHRIAYTWLRGPIVDDLPLDHLCRVRECVNPWHLEPVTIPENNARGESVSALHARQTACKNGHPFDLLNTYWRPKGGRDCRICRREANRRRSGGKAA